MKQGLTHKQSMLLDYLRRHLSKCDIAPSYEELRVAFGYASKSTIHALITQLEARGHIKRAHGSHRCLTLVED